MVSPIRTNSALLHSIAEATQVPVVKLRALIDSPSLGLTLSSTPASLDERVAQVEHSLSQLTWMAMVSPDNWKRLSADGLSYTVFSQRSRPTLSLMRPGNRMLFYVTRVGRICGVAEILAKPEQKKVVWPTGVFPFQVRLKNPLIGTPKQGCPFRPLVPSLSFIKNKEKWEGSVRGSLSLIPAKDFEIMLRCLEGTLLLKD